MGQRNLLRHLQERRAAPAKDPGSNRGVGLHDLEFIRGEPTRLEQDMVGDADLAHVVQRRCAPDQLHPGVREAKDPG